MEADSCDGINIDPTIGRNPHLRHGVIDKGDNCVHKIVLVKTTTLVVHKASKHSLSVECLSRFPLVFLGDKLVIT